MSRYLTPLPGLMAGAVEFVLARAASLDEDAERKLAPLAGRWLKFDLEGLGIELWLSADEARPLVRAEAESESLVPDAEISGTPSALLAMALPDVEGGAIRIEGDARLAQKLQQALKALDPDVERGLTDYFGDLLGPQIYRLVTDLARSGRDLARAGGEQATHWLRDESGLTPAPGEWRRFRDQVDEVREAVDRLESRLRRKNR